MKDLIQENKMVGSILPSSRFLVKKMLKDTEIEQAKVVVEFGPGNASIHKVNESVRIEDLEGLSAIYKIILTKLTSKTKN